MFENTKIHKLLDEVVNIVWALGMRASNSQVEAFWNVLKRWPELLRESVRDRVNTWSLFTLVVISVLLDGYDASHLFDFPNHL